MCLGGMINIIKQVVTIHRNVQYVLRYLLLEEPPGLHRYRFNFAKST